MVLVAYLLLRKESYLPKFLGGSAENDILFENIHVNDQLMDYVAVQIAFYMHCLLFLYCEKRRNDTLELVLYALNSLFLATAAYMHGYEQVAVIMFFLHDIADAFGWLLKALVQTHFKMACIAVWTILFPTWVYTRLYCFGYQMLPNLWALVYQQAEGQTGSFRLINVLLPILGSLLVNHIYWTVNLLVIGFIAVGNPKA